MADLYLSVIISALLVAIESAGIFLAKWTMEKFRFEREVAKIAANVAIAFSAAGGQGDLNEDIQRALEKARGQALAAVTLSMTPGPESFYLSLTLIVCLYMAFAYASPEDRAAISPILASSGPNAYPILLAAILTVSIGWVLTVIWREALITRAQISHAKKSWVIIVLLGGASLSATCYLVLGGR